MKTKRHASRGVAVFTALLLLIVGFFAGVSAPAYAGTDDYPSQWKNVPMDSTTDTWGQYVRECTSFVAYRLHSRNGFTVPNTIGYPNGAGGWGSWASQHGYTVNSTPAVGSVAWWSNSNTSGIAGHVAWVESVGSGTVTVEQYNVPGTSGTYSEHTYSTSSISGFIHFDDISPASSSAWNGVGTATRVGATLTTSQTMTDNEYLESADGRYVLFLQPDGNLVEYSGNNYLWTTATSGNQGDYLTIGTDGNVVLYNSSGRGLWDTTPEGITSLVMQGDGNLVGYTASGTAAWNDGQASSNGSISAFGSSTLKTGQTLTSSQYLQSTDGRYTALLQNDGNFVIYAPGYRTLWSSGTSGNSSAYLTVQRDGNVVLYSSAGRGLWDTTPESITGLVMQGDGNLVAYTANGTAEWNSGTTGQY